MPNHQLNKTLYIYEYILKFILWFWCIIETKYFCIFFCSVRKNASELRISLEKVVVPIFCTASAGIEEDKRQKLDKVRTPPPSPIYFWAENKSNLIFWYPNICLIWLLDLGEKCLWFLKTLGNIFTLVINMKVCEAYWTIHSLKLCIINGQPGTNGCNLFALLFVNEADARADCYESGFIRQVPLNKRSWKVLGKKEKKILHT